MEQRLTVELADEYNGDLFNDIESIVHSHEPDVEVIDGAVDILESAQTSAADTDKTQKSEKSSDKSKRTIARLAIGAVIYAVGFVMAYFTDISLYIQIPIFVAAYIILGGDVLLKALKNITRGRVFDENFLMTLSTVGAFVIGEYPEAVAVMLFYQIGELFQSMAVSRSRKSIAQLMDIRPDTANVKRGGTVVTADPATIKVGEVIVVKPGERVPLDGKVIEGKSMLDTRALTGESVPRSVKAGDPALSGCVNENGVLTIEVTKPFGESTASQILDLVENAAGRKAPTENFITTFSRYYTPIVVMLAMVLAVVPPLAQAAMGMAAISDGALWAQWVHRGFVFLVISCPCALVISIPLTFFGGIGAASKEGVLVKGSNYLEALSGVDTIVFDKTGTLTRGVFSVTSISPAGGFSAEDLLRYAALAESMSNHPIARSVTAEYSGDINTKLVKSYEEISGMGICAVADGHKVYVGNERLMEQANVKCEHIDKVGTKVLTAVDGKYAGYIIISDELKRDSKTAIEKLKALGIKKTVMLTGDEEKIAKDAAENIGIDEYCAQLLPRDKVEKLEEIAQASTTKGKLAFVGDGINDAPVLARADVGIAMGALGSDAAIEAADVVLMTDEPSKIAASIAVAKRTKHIVTQNIVLVLIVKVLFLILGAFGVAGMWEAVFGDVGVMMIAVINSMRILRDKE